jgi:signal transduction histidine kinase
LLVHELKTPLTPLIGASETLADKFKDGPYAGYVLSVYYGARQLASRVDELLDLAKGEVGQLKITKRKVNPLNIIQETMELMRPETKRRHQHLKAELPESLKPISADAGRMGQILNNLITNAMKFTPEGGTITITARETSVQLIIEVIDNGIGMSPKNIIQLFRPYRSIGRSSLSGLGLGLPLCKMLVELHNGTIEIKSKIQQGTRVILAFPINSSRSKTKRREGENLNYRG